MRLVFAGREKLSNADGKGAANNVGSSRRPIYTVSLLCVSYVGMVGEVPEHGVQPPMEFQGGRA